MALQRAQLLNRNPNAELGPELGPETSPEPGLEPVRPAAVLDRSRWSEINRIFHLAQEVDRAARRAFVAAESGGDGRVQAEVDQLLAADEAAGDYLETPLVPAGALAAAESPLAPGDVLCGRFRIVRAIAEGGMGHVFEAFDSALDVPIALKVIRPEIAANPEAAERFRREVRLARSITHPNICRTFDLERESRVQDGQTTDLVFLTMEFLPGETLSARIERAGPVPFAEALVLARQVADALHAAHTLGIIHRDMKPSNIMLVGSGERAVVTDFGLARLEPLAIALDADASSITGAGGPVGTLAYMAPEQLESAPVSPATDLYAFGLVLFEMVSGKRAFPSGNLLSGIAQRMRGSISLERQLSAETPAGWRTAIRACLQVKPEDRPRDAKHVIEMLEGRHRVRAWSANLRRMLPRTGALAAIVSIALILFAGGLRLYQTRADSKVAPGALVYLTQVKNQTGEKSLDNLTELIQSGLSQSTQVNLLDQGRVGDILQQMTRSPNSPIDQPIAREIAMRANAARVVFATVKGSKGSYALQVEVQQPDSGSPKRYRNHWSKSFAWHTDASASPSATALQTIPPDLLIAVRNASDWIRNEAGESKDDIARLDVPPEEATTDNWEALQAFSTAEKLFNQTRSEEAVVALDTAVRYDPNFALAQAFRGDVLYHLNRSGEGMAAYRAALKADTQNRLSLRERTRIQGTVAHDTLDFQTAANAYREYVLYYPNEYGAWFRLGRPLLELGRTQESIDALKQAYRVDPTKPGAAGQIVRGYLVLRDFQQAQAWLEVLRKNYPVEHYLYALGPTQFLEGDYDDAARTLETLSQSSNQIFKVAAITQWASLYAEQGKYQQALDTLDRGLSSHRDVGTQRFERADIYAKLHNYTACTDDMKIALQTESGPDGILMAIEIASRALAAAPPTQAGGLLDLLHSLEAGLTSEDFSLASDLLRHRVRGELLLTEGDPDGAVLELRKAAALDASINPKDYLARALTAAARKNPHGSEAASQIREAAAIYAATAEHPETIWWFSTGYPPGIYADSLESWLQLSAAYPAIVPGQSSLAHDLSRLRPHSKYSAADATGPR